MEARHAVLSVEAPVEAPDRTGTHQTATAPLAEVRQEVVP
jgi:hypothetical protein